MTPFPLDLRELAARANDEATSLNKSLSHRERYLCDDLLDTWNKTGSLTGDLWESATLHVRRSSALQTEVTALSRHPAYESQVLPRQFPVLSVQRELHLAGRVYQHNAETTKAVEVHLTALFLGLHHPASNLFEYAIGAFSVGSAARHFSDLAATTADSASLRYALEELNALAVRLPVFPGLDPVLLEAIADLRSARRAGIAVDMETTRTPAEIARHAWDVGMRQEQRRPGMRRLTSWLRRIRVRALPTVFPALGKLSYSRNPDFVEIRQRTQAARARFDLMRLQLAQRIWTLEHGQPPRTLEELVPSLIPESPNDPFTGKPFLIAPEGQLYSVGPDGSDEQLNVVYDPTNGVGGRGDISLMTRTADQHTSSR